MGVVEQFKIIPGKLRIRQVEGNRLTTRRGMPHAGGEGFILVLMSVDPLCGVQIKGCMQPL